MTTTEFVDTIENGSDILLDVQGHHLCIFTWCTAGIGIGTQNDDTPLKIYANASQLDKEYTVNGIPLSHLLDKIIITDYT